VNPTRSQRWRRTYFNNPLVEESLQHLPAAVDHPTSVEFRHYLLENLHHSSVKTRNRFSEYIAQRFSENGRMNPDLAQAIRRFGDSRTSREILYFELIESVPLLLDCGSLWLAVQTDAGFTRADLVSFLASRLQGKQVDRVSAAVVMVFRKCRKVVALDRSHFRPLWAEPSLEAFLYVLARLFPERTMTRIDSFMTTSLVRAMLWPQSAVEKLLDKAVHAGHISRVSRLDQYHQFTLEGSGAERMRSVVGLAQLASDGTQRNENCVRERDGDKADQQEVLGFVRNS
jgi:hypothetical protein